MAIKADFSGVKTFVPGGTDVKVNLTLRPREITQIYPSGGGNPMEERKTVVDSDHLEYRWALVTYKSMEQVIKENPNHFFDGYGNFNNGRKGEGESDTYHLAPSYFGQMGKTAHRRYMKEDGIQDTWYYTVIDR